ncbi:MAG: hypothetical protein ABIR84_13675 [Candidatus Nitrotoga sp.]
MDIKTLKQALKLQSDLTTRLTQSIASHSTGKIPSIEVTLKEKEQLIARAQAEVEIAIKERDTAVSRWDERIAQRKASVDKLKEELNDLKKHLTERHEPPRNKKTGNSKKTTIDKKLQ